MLKVYGKNNGCPKCNNAKKELDSRQIKYEFIDVNINDRALKFIKNKKFKQVPVFEYENEFYSDLKETLFMMGEK